MRWEALDRLRPARRPAHARLRRVLGPVVGLGLVLALPVPAARAQGFGGRVEDMLVRGDSLLVQQRPQEAIVQYQESRTLCPTPFEIVSALQGEGRARLLLGELLQAAGLFEEAVERFPGDPRVAELLYLAGSARKHSGDIEGGVALLRRALESSPTGDYEPIIRFQLAQAVRFLGRPDETVELLKEFETEYPDPGLLPNVLYTLGIASHDSGDIERAERVYRSLLERFPATQAAVEAQFDLAAVIAERGRRAEAVDLYRRFVGGNPNSPVAARGLERAGDLLLFHAPRESAELYALAAVKAAANPTPPVPELAVSRFLPVKRALAGALSRAWVVVILAMVLLAAIGGAVLAGRRLVRRSRAPEQAGA